ncbi:MAG: hypothetical protein ABSC06_11830 [Rhodopila sp.]|jgi:hypothetical protein
MARLRLLEATCTIALLAATPALAQRPEAGMTNPNGQPNPEASQTQQPATGSNAPANDGANTTGMVKPNSSAMETHSTRRTAMNHARNDTSQDAAVNKLNDESYRASQNGQAFSVSRNESGPSAASGAPGTITPGASGTITPGTTSGTSAGSMPSNVSGGSGAKP